MSEPQMFYLWYSKKQRKVMDGLSPPIPLPRGVVEGEETYYTECHEDKDSRSKWDDAVYLGRGTIR